MLDFSTIAQTFYVLMNTPLVPPEEKEEKVVQLTDMPVRRTASGGYGSGERRRVGIAVWLLFLDPRRDTDVLVLVPLFSAVKRLDDE
jgi:RNA-binding protein YlmH